MSCQRTLVFCTSRHPSTTQAHVGSLGEKMVQRFTNMKVAHKLTLGFGIVLLLMLGTLAADVFASTQQSAVADRLVHHLYPAREAAEQILTWDRSADDDGGRGLSGARKHAGGLD